MLLFKFNKFYLIYASPYLRYTDIFDFKVSQVSMKLVIDSCSKCLYHFLANTLTKHPINFHANRSNFMEDMIREKLVPFFMPHSVECNIFEMLHSLCILFILYVFLRLYNIF